MDTRSLGLLYRDKRGKRGEVGEKRRETGSGREECGEGPNAAWGAGGCSIRTSAHMFLSF